MLLRKKFFLRGLRCLIHTMIPLCIAMAKLPYLYIAIWCIRNIAVQFCVVQEVARHTSSNGYN